MTNYIIKTAGDIETIAHELKTIAAVYGKNTKLIDLLTEKEKNNILKDGKKA